MKSSVSLRSTFNWSMIIIAILSVTIVSSFLMAQEYWRASTELIRQKDDFIAAKKKELIIEVNRTIDYINYKRATTEQQLKDSIQTQVNGAIAIANGLYNSHHGIKSDDEIKKMIKEALRPLIFNNGRGYFFIYDMQGNNVLLPFSPHLEGKNLWNLKDSKGNYTIQRTVKIIREKGEGFQHWYWYKPGDNRKMAEKIGFSKHFKPYDWFIGTGEYIEDFQRDIQKETLEWINTIRFGQDGYIFVYNFNGTILAHYTEETIGTNALQNTTDQYGVKIVGELIRLSQQDGGGFLEYEGQIRPSTGMRALKIGHSQSVKDWQWTVGAGVYVDSINELINAERKNLIKQLIKNILISLLLFAFSLMVIWLALRYLSQRIARHLSVFTDFFEKASTELVKIDDEAVHFSEFKLLARSANQMVDDRKRADEELKRSANFTSALLNAIPTPVFYKNRNGLYQGCNRAFTEFMGVTPDEIQGKAAHELWPNDYAEKYHTKDQGLISNPQHQVYDFKVKNKQGEDRPVIYTKDVYRDEDGEVAGIVGAFLDISQLKQTEEELRNANDIINRSPFVTFLWKNCDGWVVEYVSENVKELFGYSAEDFISGKLLFNTTIHPEDLARVVTEIKKNSQDKNTTDFRHEPYRIVTKNGEIKWVADLTHTRRDSEGAISHYEGIVYDITDRKRAEEAQLESYRMLQLVINTIPVRVFWKDLNLCYLGCNYSFAVDAGKTNPEEVIGKDDFEMGWVDQAGQYRKDDLAAITAGSARIDYEEPQTTPDGNEIWLLTSKVPMRDNQNKIIGLLGTYQDITERKAAEKELQQLRNYLSNIINSMPSALVGVDSEGRVTQWNKTIEQNSGISAEDAQGKVLSDILPAMASEMKKILRSIKTREIIQEQKRRHTVLQQARFEDLTIYPLITNGAEGAVIRIDDVTEKTRIEEMMVHSEKMLSVGGLAAGMAHEINNPLAGVLQTSQVMANRLKLESHIPANQKAAEELGITVELIEAYMKARGIPRMLDAIVESSHRMAKIVRNVLSFARKNEDAVSTHTFEHLLDETLELVATDYDLKKQYDFKQITIEKEYQASSTYVPCEASKIQQVLLNIFKNGAEAMQEAYISFPKFIIRTFTDKERQMGCIEIEDNGPGMDDSTRRRIFEPFFTTKPEGVGTGLGLSVSYFIIKENHGGEMSVESSPGKGAKFIICLPLKGR